MINAAISLPALPTLINSASKLADAKKNMDNARANKYAAEIAQAEKFSGVPFEVFGPFAQHETEWKNVANKRGSSARGPMQLMPDTAVYAICNNAKWITEECKDVIRRLIGTKRANGYFRNGPDDSEAIRNYGGISPAEILKSPELCILCGALHIAFLIRRHTHNGEVDICRVLAQYAQGANFKTIGTTPYTVYLSASRKAQAKEYLKSMVGKNGLMTAYQS